MKINFSIFMALVFSLFFSGVSFAENYCSAEAVSAARTESPETGYLKSLTELEAEKPYLEAYYVELESSDLETEEAFTIVLMKSSCSIVSMIREL